MRPFIVAELSANHMGDLQRAKDLVSAAAWAGADAIKLQTWSPGTMCVNPQIQAPEPWQANTLMDLYASCWTPWDWHAELFQQARDLGMEPFSAAFDAESVDFLETLGVQRHKVASFELTDLPLIRYMASKGKPMILSTGMATLAELAKAILACSPVWDLTILKCTSAYPADASDANLMAMMRADVLTGLTGLKPGLSDHTLGIGVAVAATALGATMIEKHLTLRRRDGGVDAGFSMEPTEFRQMVTECHRAYTAIGEVRYGPGPNESTAMRRSLWAVRNIESGESLVFGVNIRTARPALGLPCDTNLQGCRASRTIYAGEPLIEEHISR